MVHCLSDTDPIDYCLRATRNKCFLSQGEPNTFKQALKSPNKKEWLAAIYQEFDQLVRQYTFAFLDRKKVPKDRRPITSRLVLKTKKDRFNTVIKYKTRLIARGF